VKSLGMSNSLPDVNKRTRGSDGECLMCCDILILY
jgi:hypothetical protein